VFSVLVSFGGILSLRETKYPSSMHLMNDGRTTFFLFLSRVARWFVFKPKNPYLGKFWRALDWKNK
jgi:hypothetical protein